MTAPQSPTVAGMTPIVAAFVAELIDAHGSIMICRKIRRRLGIDGPVQLIRFQPKVQVASRDEGLLRSLAMVARVGGVYDDPPNGRAQWQVFTVQARRLVEQIRPHLDRKIQQADLLLAFPVASKGLRGPAGDQIHAEQAAIYEKMRKLNGKLPAKTSAEPDQRFRDLATWLASLDPQQRTVSLDEITERVRKALGDSG